MVFPDRLDDVGSWPGTSRAELVYAFAQVPAVVASLLDQVDFLPQVLTHVAAPQRARLAIESDAPRIAQPVGIDLGGLVLLADERIVRGNSVGPLAVAPVNVDPQDLSEQRIEILAVLVGIVGQAAVAGGDVQITVGPERDRPALVVPKRLLDLEQSLFRVGVGPIRVVFRHAEPRDGNRVGLLRFGGRVVDEELAVVAILRMKRQAQKSLFVLLVFVDHARRDVEEHGRLLDRWIVGEHVNRALLRGHEDPIRSVAGVRQQNRTIDPKVGKHLLDFQAAGRVRHRQRRTGVRDRRGGQRKQLAEVHPAIVSRVVTDLPQHDQVEAGHDQHAVAEFAHRRKCVARHAPIGARTVVPPQVSISLVEILRGAGSFAHPVGREQRLAAPLPLVQHQQPETGQRSGRDVQTGIGRRHSVARLPTPVVTGNPDLLEHLLVEKLVDVLAGRFVDHRAQQTQPGVVVDPLFAGREIHRQLVQHVREQIRAPQNRVVALGAGSHREQLPHGDLALLGRIGVGKKIAHLAIER